MSRMFRKKRISVPAPQKDSYSYEELYTEYWPILVSLFKRTIPDPDESEDLAQLTMIRVWIYWDKIQWDKLENVIGVIANGIKCDYMNKRHTQSFIEFESDELEFEGYSDGITDPMRALVNSQLDEVFNSIFLHIDKARDREVFLDYYVKELDIEQLCDKHKITRNHAYLIFHKCRNIVRDAFDYEDFIE